MTQGARARRAGAPPRLCLYGHEPVGSVEGCSSCDYERRVTRAEPQPAPLGLVLVELVRTCMSCPAQWDARTDAGVVLYIRERHGRLEVRAAAAGDEDAVAGTSIFVWQHGTMAYDDAARMLEATGMTLAEGVTETGLRW